MCNQTEVWNYDKNGEVISDSDGIACTAMTYNVMGDCVREAFYGSNGQAISGPSGYAVREMIYDAAARIIQYNYYDKNGMSMSSESGWLASISQQWNDMGDLTEHITYDETGGYFLRENSVACIVYTYDSGENSIAKHYYDAQDQLISMSVMVAYVNKVEEGSQADLAGVQENDIILQQGDWSFFSYDGFDAVDFDELYYTIVESGGRSRNLCACKTNDYNNGVFVFQNYAFEADSIGFYVTSTWLDLEIVEQMQEQYLQWRGNVQVQ